MLRKLPPWAAALILVYFLFFFRLTGTGLLGPDEPRYAAIGRAMSRSGDWITPRLWGEPWFEKPPLLYWMTALGFSAGLGDDLAPRLSVALGGALFLLFYFHVLRREFGLRPALFATTILGTSAAWVAFSRVAVTDLPMAAAFSAAMLLCLPWVERGDPRRLTPAAALFGLAVLAKGLVPLVLALPLLWVARRRWRDLLRPGPLAAFLLVASPWYVLVTLRNGTAFLEEFFWKHHLARFASDALQHEQPFWFYLPVLLGLLYPWTPLVALLFRKTLYKAPGRRLLALWAAFGFVFFSAAANKLPGYLLPLLPAVAALLGIALAEAPRARWVLAGCGALFGVALLIQEVLPVAIARGITHVKWPGPSAALVSSLGAALAIWALERSGRRLAAVVALAALMSAAAVRIETRTLPVLDRTVSARAFWHEIATRAGGVCVGDVNRSWRYGLNYYAGTPLPDCSQEPRPLHVEQDTTRGPRLEAAVPRGLSP